MVAYVTTSEVVMLGIALSFINSTTLIGSSCEMSINAWINEISNTDTVTVFSAFVLIAMDVSASDAESNWPVGNDGMFCSIITATQMYEDIDYKWKCSKIQTVDLNGFDMNFKTTGTLNTKGRGFEYDYDEYK